MIYNYSSSHLSPHENGTHLILKDEKGKCVGEIDAIKKRKVESLELKYAMKNLMKVDDTVEELAARLLHDIKDLCVSITIRYMF